MGVHLYEILRRPILSEKSSRLQEEGKYVFEVHDTATKSQVKKAVELAFKVKVVKVNIAKIPGKRRRFGRREVVGPSWKKAVVTLEPGHKIQFFEGV